MFWSHFALYLVNPLTLGLFGSGSNYEDPKSVYDELFWTYFVAFSEFAVIYASTKIGVTSVRCIRRSLKRASRNVIVIIVLATLQLSIALILLISVHSTYLSLTLAAQLSLLAPFAILSGLLDAHAHIYTPSFDQVPRTWQNKAYF